jgi:hypothetical protein
LLANFAPKSQVALSNKDRVSGDGVDSGLVQIQTANELKTYALLTLTSVLTVVAVTFFLSVSGFSQHVFKTFIVEHPILNFIITPITFVMIIYFAKQYCHFK